MKEFLIDHIEFAAAYAHIWGFAIVFLLMTVESSFIPFPSEVIMIPAGFMACRGELTTGVPVVDLLLVIVCGVLGSIAGANVNYFLALKLGRPVLHKYGKYFFLSPNTVERAEEIFNEYGNITTFVCRLLPAIRQLISIPAGLSRMNLWRFTLFTTLGAGIWSAILGLIGYYFGAQTKDMKYRELVIKGNDFLKQHFVWILLALMVIIVLYALIHHRIMKSSKNAKTNAAAGPDAESGPSQE